MTGLEWFAYVILPTLIGGGIWAAILISERRSRSSS
jgi:hypothetical protein